MGDCCSNKTDNEGYVNEVVKDKVRKRSFEKKVKSRKQVK